MKKFRATDITLPVYGIAATLQVHAAKGRLEVSLRSGESSAPLGVVDTAAGRVVLRANILHPDIRRRVLVTLADGLEGLALAYDEKGNPLTHKDGRPKLSDIAPLTRPLARQARTWLRSL